VTANQAQDALVALNLDEPGDIRWAERSFDDGVFTFTGLSFTSDEMEAPLQAERLVLAAPRLDGEIVRFDQLEVTGLSLAGAGVLLVRLWTRISGALGLG